MAGARVTDDGRRSLRWADDRLLRQPHRRGHAGWAEARCICGRARRRRGPVLPCGHAECSHRLPSRWSSRWRYAGSAMSSFSRPGYGVLDAPAGRSIADVVDDTRAVLDQLGVERAWSVGWSGGGPHALACAALMPERVRGAATIAIVAPYPAEGLDYLAGMGEENVEEFKAALEGPDALHRVQGAELADLQGRDRRRGRRLVRRPRRRGRSRVADRRVRGVPRGSVPRGRSASRTGAGSTTTWRSIKPWGFDLASIGVPVHVWQGRPRPDGPVRPRRVACLAHPGSADPAPVRRPGPPVASWSPSSAGSSTSWSLHGRPEGRRAGHGARRADRRRHRGAGHRCARAAARRRSATSSAAWRS